MTVDSTDDPKVVDCRGMQCPAPILRLAEAARKFKDTGETLVILATDDDFPTDLKAWCRSTKSEVVSVTRQGNVIRATVTLAGGPSASAAKPSAISVPRTSPSAPSVTRSFENDARQQQVPAPRSSTSQPDTTAASSRTTVDAIGLSAVQAIRKLSEVVSAGGPQEVRLVGDGPGLDAKIIAWAMATDSQVQSVRRDGTQMLFDILLATEDFAAPTLAPTPPATAAPAALAPAPAIEPLATALDAPAPTSSALALTANSLAIAAAPSDELTPAVRENRATILVLKNDLEGLLAAMMCANAAAAQGMKVDMFFSFWAVHLLRGERPRANMDREPVGFVEGMMRYFVPSGPGRQQLAKLRMGGMGTRMLNWLMKRRKILTLDQLVEQAVKQDVRFIVCSMSMGLMGLTKRDIVDLPNVEFAGVASFVEHSGRSSMSLVF
ncbi:MAG: DsrE/DsrF/DrsH-like family protein [Deltaproteobacteria bacterium]|nr:DsrE/DsrF/DrsH-like family protein [Deltaproteobacteria bacterium]